MDWYPFLLDTLRDPAITYYVEELMVEEQTLLRHPDMDPFSVLPGDEALIREAVEGEDWIPKTEKEQFMDKILAENEPAMVTLMVPRMPNLRRLGLAVDFTWEKCGEDVEEGIDPLTPIVARIAQAASNAKDQGRAVLPLSKVEHFQGLTLNTHTGMDFEMIAPLMALPSLRTVSMRQNHGDNFDWPTSLPKSHVREIELTQSTVPREAILRVAKGIRGPCMIRQEWGWRRYDLYAPVPTWDSLEIPREDAGEEEWTLLLKPR